MGTRINTKEWLDWNVGKGKRFKNLCEVLTELHVVRIIFGNNCGYAGGNINDEIKIVEEMITKWHTEEKENIEKYCWDCPEIVKDG